MITETFTMGIEEEYLLVDLDSLDLAKAPDALMTACQADLQDQVSPEFLQCQIEIGTKVCANVAEAREQLKFLRSTVAKHAAKFNLAPIAVSCHPFADWKDQHHTQKDRYSDLERAMGGVVRRMLICGMHVHVGISDNALRTDLMPQMCYFLPHLLALSTSSPFWQGDDSSLASYRLSVFDNLPRTGLPPQFTSWDEYQRTCQTLIDLGVIEDSTKIWWDMRPSHRFPTLETRIFDVSPRLEHALSLAALNQALLRMLYRLKTRNLRWRQYDRFLISENRWRAQRYGITDGLIDFGDRTIHPFDHLLDELIGLVAEDAEALDSLNEISALKKIYLNTAPAHPANAASIAEALATGDKDNAGRAVVKHLIEEFNADL